MTPRPPELNSSSNAAPSLTSRLLGYGNAVYGGGEGKAQSQGIRPPTLTRERGGGLTFELSNVVKEYYGLSRWLGYSFGVWHDWTIDAKLDKNEEVKSNPALRSELKKKESQWFSSCVEFPVFALTTVIYALRDWRDMLRYFRGSLAAEQGRAQSSVNGWDMLRSPNPIIQTAVKRFGFMQLVRFGADTAFLKDLNWGLLGMASRITFERTLFNQKTAYDRLERLFQDVQIDHFDLHAPAKIAKEIGNIVQQSQKDHNRSPWELELIQHYNPLFEALGNAVASKNIGMPGAIYVLGELMTKRMTLEDSLALTERVTQKGLDSLRVEPLRFPSMDPAEKPVSGKSFTNILANLSAPQLQTLLQGANEPRSFTNRAERPEENVAAMR